MIGIVDYGIGNVLAFANVYRRLNIPVIAARTPDELRRASRIILPGVGAFDKAMESLDNSGLREPLEERVKGGGVPLLGVCIGMHMLAGASDEGNGSGLGWVPGHVRRFNRDHPVRTRFLPHMGWNDVSPVDDHGLFAGLGAGARFYFLHSYYFECDDTDSVLASTEYGSSFCSAVGYGKIFGVQFHPEKSHRFGVRLLQNFAHL